MSESLPSFSSSSTASSSSRPVYYPPSFATFRPSSSIRVGSSPKQKFLSLAQQRKERERLAAIKKQSVAMMSYLRPSTSSNTAMSTKADHKSFAASSSSSLSSSSLSGGVTAMDMDITCDCGTCSCKEAKKEHESTCHLFKRCDQLTCHGPTPALVSKIFKCVIKKCVTTTTWRPLNKNSKHQQCANCGLVYGPCKTCKAAGAWSTNYTQLVELNKPEMKGLFFAHMSKPNWCSNTKCADHRVL